MAGGLPAVMARGVPAPAAIPAGAIASAEVAAAEVVRRVQPTQASERRRADVVDYARRIVGTALGCEVFLFGSVPLKTYLPDGDIDLTVIGNTSCDSTLIDDIYYILESGEQNTNAEFEVKDLEHIDAEVRLIKCTIGNIIVDLSFNQTGGMATLLVLCGFEIDDSGEYFVLTKENMVIQDLKDLITAMKKYVTSQSSTAKSAITSSSSSSVGSSSSSLSDAGAEERRKKLLEEKKKIQAEKDKIKKQLQADKEERKHLPTGVCSRKTSKPAGGANSKTFKDIGVDTNASRGG